MFRRNVSAPEMLMLVILVIVGKLMQESQLLQKRFYHGPSLVDSKFAVKDIFTGYCYKNQYPDTKV